MVTFNFNCEINYTKYDMLRKKNCHKCETKLVWVEVFGEIGFFDLIFGHNFKLSWLLIWLKLQKSQVFQSSLIDQYRFIWKGMSCFSSRIVKFEGIEYFTVFLPIQELRLVFKKFSFSSLSTNWADFWSEIEGVRNLKAPRIPFWGFFIGF